jgi:hypothetical protein
MMGQQGGMQDRLFYSFNLDDHIPLNHNEALIDSLILAICASIWRLITATPDVLRSIQS